MEIQRLRIEKGLWNPCLHGFQKVRWRSSEDYPTLPQCPEIASFIGLVFCRFLGKKDTQKISNSWDGIFSHITHPSYPGLPGLPIKPSPVPGSLSGVLSGPNQIMAVESSWIYPLKTGDMISETHPQSLPILNRYLKTSIEGTKPWALPDQVPISNLGYWAIMFKSQFHPPRKQQQSLGFAISCWLHHHFRWFNDTVLSRWITASSTNASRLTYWGVHPTWWVVANTWIFIYIIIYMVIIHVHVL
jgi:hypothetical protein